MFRVARQNNREGTQVTTAALAYMAYQNLLVNDPLTKKDFKFKRECPSCAAPLNVKVAGSDVELVLATTTSSVVDDSQLPTTSSLPAELEHGLGDEYHLEEPYEDTDEVEDSQNVGLIDDEFYDEDSEVSDENYNSLGSDSPTQVPRLGVGLTSTQLDELDRMRSLSPELLS